MAHPSFRFHTTRNCRPRPSPPLLRRGDVCQTAWEVNAWHNTTGTAWRRITSRAVIEVCALLLRRNPSAIRASWREAKRRPGFVKSKRGRKPHNAARPNGPLQLQNAWTIFWKRWNPLRTQIANGHSKSPLATSTSWPARSNASKKDVRIPWQCRKTVQRRFPRPSARWPGGFLK